MRLLFCLLSLLLCSLTQGQVSRHATQQLINADKAFSELSRQKGMKYAFLQYIDSAGVLLRKNQYPLAGPKARALLQAVNDSSFTLTWEPSAAFIARSGELGYTYGVYTTALKDTTLHGTYVS